MSGSARGANNAIHARPLSLARGLLLHRLRRGELVALYSNKKTSFQSEAQRSSKLLQFEVFRLCLKPLDLHPHLPLLA